MTYFVEIDAELSAILLGGEEGEDSEEWFLRVKKEIKDKILESYRNGQKAGAKPKPTQTGKTKPKTDAYRTWKKHIDGS